MFLGQSCGTCIGRPLPQKTLGLEGAAVEPCQEDFESRAQLTEYSRDLVLYMGVWHKTLESLSLEAYDNSLSHLRNIDYIQ